jgi:hypothetical protein
LSGVRVALNSLLALLSGVLSAAPHFAQGRASTLRRIAIANRKGHTVNATFVDEATRRIDGTPCSFVFAARRHRFSGTTPSLRHRVTRKTSFRMTDSIHRTADDTWHSFRLLI